MTITLGTLVVCYTLRVVELVMRDMDTFLDLTDRYGFTITAVTAVLSAPAYLAWYGLWCCKLGLYWIGDRLPDHPDA